MNYKQTMGEEQKEKLLGNRRAKYNAMDILMKKELVSVNANRSMESVWRGRLFCESASHASRASHASHSSFASRAQNY